MKHHISFKHALDGIIYNFTTQPNFRFHIFAATIIIITGFFFHITSIEWLIITFTILLVILIEMANTALESVVDLLVDNYHLDAKIAKDTTAGMVLISATASVIIGFIIFIPYLINFFN